jgi:hypothetical protein
LGKTNIIEFNGKRYDAVSGAPADDQTYHVPVTVQSKPVAPKTNGHNVDGIIRPTGQLHHGVQTVKPVASPPVAAHQQTRPKHSTHHIVAHRPQHSKTLMRASVKKPGPSSLRAKLHLQAPMQAVAKTEHHLPANHHDVDISRLTRAKATAKSAAISRFGEPTRNSFVKHIRPLAVKAAPVATNIDQQHSSPFDAAVASATSHQQVAPKRSRRTSRLFNIAAAGLALLLIGGFIAYQNVPNIELRMISSRAGFSATMPGFKPTGFGISSPIHYSAGEVTLGFHSASASRSYSVIEQQSNWDSQTLLDNFVSSTGQNYQAVQSAGRTIYLYNGNATWVNGSIWYRVTSNANLSPPQLINIATSM